MPGAHRHGDGRMCGATTIVQGQTTVKVNGILWAVQGDPDTHCVMGNLIPAYGAMNVYAEGKLVICAQGDTASSDLAGCFVLHPSGTTDPTGHSPNVIVYGGAAGGGS